MEVRAPGRSPYIRGSGVAETRQSTSRSEYSRPGVLRNSPSAAAEAEIPYRMLSVTFLGTGAAIPTLDRNVSALALHREGEMLLFDCGEGTQRQMMRYGVGFSLREIFFTHYHSDHILGLTGLIRTMGLQDRTDGITLYGPKPARRILGAVLNVGIERTKFPVEIVEVAAGDRLARAEYDSKRERAGDKAIVIHASFSQRPFISADEITLLCLHQQPKEQSAPSTSQSFLFC